MVVVEESLLQTWEIVEAYREDWFGDVWFRNKWFITNDDNIKYNLILSYNFVSSLL